MRVAIMQPYFLPYIGYFQLMAAVDKFVILDDVNYINRGWVNRNRLPKDQGTCWLTLPLLNASQNRLIRELDIFPDDGWKSKMRGTIATCYAQASNRELIRPLVDLWLSRASQNLSTFLVATLCDVAEYCGIATEIVKTSSVYPRSDLRAQHRILDICLREGANVYVNPPGGKDLYDHALFAARGVQLQFLQPTLSGLGVKHSGTEGPVLSILDLLMQNTPEVLSRAVHTFELVQPEWPLSHGV